MRGQRYMILGFFDKPHSVLYRLFEIHRRFAAIEAGHSLTKEFDLTRSVRKFWHTRGAISIPGGGSEVVPFAGEQLGKYEIPANCKSILVTVTYARENSDACDGFFVYFRERPESLDLAEGRFSTKTLRLALK